MELEGKSNAATSMISFPTKTLEEKPRTNPSPDPDQETKPGSGPVFKPPAVHADKKENQRPRTRGGESAKYRECQKNHAALTGGHVLDGCCEFMPGGEEDKLKCAACNCHRSFHRKEVYGRRSNAQELITPAFYCGGSSYKAMQPREMYPTVEIGRRASSSSEDMRKILNHRNENVDGKGSMMMMMMMRKKKNKRVRTKINEEQKEKMKEFAERLGWRIQKKDEEEIDKFCRMVNLKRQVFKVWMHNNKQAIKRNCYTSDLQK